MSLKSWLASTGGDVWVSHKCVGLWPWPAMVVGYPKTKFTWADYRNFGKVKSGDIILTQSRHYLISNKAIKGTAFRHAALYIGPVNCDSIDNDHFLTNPRVAFSADEATHPKALVHAISEGVVCQDLGELLFHSDYAMAVRPWTHDAERATMVKYALKQVGKGYDFDFDFKKHKALACTELAAMAAMNAGCILPEKSSVNTSIAGLFLPLARWKKQAYLADSFMCYPAVAASASCKELAFRIQTRVPELLDKCLWKVFK